MKKGLSASSSPVMLIGTKLMKDKRCASDFRHINIRLAKTNVAFPPDKDTFWMLGSYKCEVLLVIDLKDAFHSLRPTEDFKKYCWILAYFGIPFNLYWRMLMGLNISPAIWQLYINAIWNCLLSRK